MEQKQLLLISKNNEFIQGIKSILGQQIDLTSVKSVHAGYTIALSHLPDVILIDYSSFGKDGSKNLKSFKSTHFLSKTHLFLYGENEDKEIMEKQFKKHVDDFLYDSLSYRAINEKIEEAAFSNKCSSNYWKDSFMGLFNLLGNPVILLQHDKILAMNDSFKKYFFVKSAEKVKLIDFVDCKNHLKVQEILRNFIRGKHMKASTKTSLLLKNKKIREAKITFSKLDKSLSGQMILMINFSANDIILNEEIGTSSCETEEYFKENNSAEGFKFTKREKEIIELLCKGYKTKEISESLCISTKTIEKHRSNIIKRTNSETILESIIYALNHRMIDIDR